MTIDVESERDAHIPPGAVISGRANGQEPQSRPASRQRRLAVLSVELGAVARLLRSRRFHENVIIGVIGLAALASLSQENQARAVARLAAWDKRQKLRDQRTAKTRPV